MKAVLIPGDGIGPEIAKSVEDISAAMKLDIEWVTYQAGAEYAATTKEVFESGLVDAIKEYKWALKGPTATPIGTGFRSVNVALRQQFDTYANVRPIRSFKGIKSKYEDVDLVIIRENTEDLYKGIEYMVTKDVANGVKLITRQASEKICRYAFEYAKNNNRQKVTAVHKANIMKYTDGLFLEAFR
ncbi:MAG: isocitrate/isopropylmalate family dehydrogenase, partial [Coprobacillus sp.]